MPGTVFETSIGPVGLAWVEDDVVAVQLPEGTAEATADHLARRLPGLSLQAPPAAIQAIVDRIVRHLDGEPDDLLDVPVDLAAASPFHRRVYAAVRSISPGSTRTYGEVAAVLGDTDHRAAQAVGQAMAANPAPIVVPCHRVLAAGGQLGGFSAPGGTATKERMLVIEGARPAPPPTLFDVEDLTSA